MFFLYHHLEKGSFINCYADTDSMCLATTKSLSLSEKPTDEEKLRAIFDPIVRPEMRESWEAQWKVIMIKLNIIFKCIIGLAMHRGQM